MTVSIGIPFFNSKHTLADAIRSVFAQTFTDWELILVDDGSTDGSLEIARTVDDPRVRVLSDGVNRGLPYRLNQIAREAVGEYIARMDADDVMHPNRLFSQIEFLEENPKIDVVGTATYIVDAFNEPVSIRSESPLRPDAASVLRDGLFIHPTITGHRKWFVDNPYDGLYVRSEDHELWCRTCGKSRFGKIRKPLHFYRESYLEPEIYLRNYLRTLVTSRLIYKNYGPSLIGRPGALALIARTQTKEYAYRLATAMGLQKSIIHRRNTPLSPEQAGEACKQLRAVMNTQIPGLLTTEEAPPANS